MGRRGPQEVKQMAGRPQRAEGRGVRGEQAKDRRESQPKPQRKWGKIVNGYLSRGRVRDRYTWES